MKSKNTFKGLLVLCAFGLASACFAQDTSTAPSSSAPSEPQQGQWQHPPRNPAFEAARKACWESVPKQQDGRPEHGAMRACLQAKGFNPPEHHFHGGQGQEQGQPPQGGQPEQGSQD
jgi:hypothetical protein